MIRGKLRIEGVRFLVLDLVGAIQFFAVRASLVPIGVEFRCIGDGWAVIETEPDAEALGWLMMEIERS